MRAIEFVHPFNHEKKILEVTLITSTYVSVYWPLSGTYDLNLRDNILTARSQGARRRNKCLWTAVNIEAVREAAKIHLAKQDIKEDVRAKILTHEATKPVYPSYPYARRPTPPAR